MQQSGNRHHPGGSVQQKYYKVNKWSIIFASTFNSVNHAYCIRLLHSIFTASLFPVWFCMFILSVSKTNNRPAECCLNVPHAPIPSMPQNMVNLIKKWIIVPHCVLHHDTVLHHTKLGCFFTQSCCIAASLFLFSICPTYFRVCIRLKSCQ